MSFPARPLACMATAALALAIPAQAFAVEPLDTFSVRLSGYVSTFDTSIRADGETERGTPVDLHRDLGLDKDNIIANIGLTWRPWEHHEFGLGYYTQSADKTRVTQRDIEFDGTLYQAQSTVRAESDIDAYEAYYVWWAASNERWALGPRFGLVWYRMKLGLALEVDANGNQVGGSISNDVSADLPAPTIGGSWRWAFHDDWRMSADAGYFSMNVNDVDGSVWFGRLGIEWFPWERSGFLLDYTISKIKVDATKSDFDGNVDFKDSGLRLGYVYRF
ncbi:hypothetical protein [Lysobacter sp. P5_B9]